MPTTIVKCLPQMHFHIYKCNFHSYKIHLTFYCKINTFLNFRSTAKAITLAKYKLLYELFPLMLMIICMRFPNSVDTYSIGLTIWPINTTIGHTQYSRLSSL